MKEIAPPEDRLSRPPARTSVLEEKVFSIFDAILRNRDYLAARGISAFDTITKIDHRLVELTRLHENFRMAVLPDGGLKWKVLSGRTKMGKEMFQLAGLCQELFDNLAALCDSTCRRGGFLRARQIAGEQHQKLTSEQSRKQFYRDIWVPDAQSLPKYLEDDEWFLGLAEGLSKALLGLAAAAFVLKVAYKDEFELLFASAAGRIEELSSAGISVPHEYHAYTDPARVERQRKIFDALALPASEAILVRYQSEVHAFSDLADKLLFVHGELEAVVKRIVMYRDFFELQLSFSHPELDAFIGYLSGQERQEPEAAYLHRHISDRKLQFEAQKTYYMGRLWRMTPQQLERTRLNVAAERDGFRKEETAQKARITDTIRLLKAHRRDWLDDLRSLDHFDKDNDLNILKLPSDIDLRMSDEELASVLSGFRRCVQIRMEEFTALSGRLRDEVIRSRASVESSTLPETARRMLLDAIGDFGYLRPGTARPHFNEQYLTAVEYYKALSATRRGLGELCLQLISSDLLTRCREFEKQDQRFSSHFAGLARKAGLPAAYGGEGLEDLVWKCGVAHEILYKEELEFLTSCKRSLLEGIKARLARAERTITLDEMLRKLELIAGLEPRRPASLGEELAALEKYRQELFTHDLLADAQQYWMKVRELGESLSASIRVNLDVSMVTVEDRRATPESVLDRLDSKFSALSAALDGRLAEVGSNLAQVPELNDLRLAGKQCPELKDCAGNERTLPSRRLHYLETALKEIRSARETTEREVADLHRTAVELHLPEDLCARLKGLANQNLDAAVVGLASVRMAVREHLGNTIRETLAGLEIPDSGRWELPAGATMRSWFSVWAEFLEVVTESARSTIEEASDLREKLAGSDEANRLRKKNIGRFPLRELLRASDSASMRDMSYLLFDAEGDMETVRREIELALKRHDLPGVVQGIRRWRLLRKRLGETAARRYAPGETPLIEALRDFEDRRLREFALSKNRSAFPDRAFIQDIERAMMRCRLKDKKISSKDFQKVMAALQKDGEAAWKDYSDRFLLTPGEHPEYRLTVAPLGDQGDMMCGTVHWGEKCVEFVYDPKRMLLTKKEK